MSARHDGEMKIEMVMIGMRKENCDFMLRGWPRERWTARATIGGRQIERVSAGYLKMKHGAAAEHRARRSG